MTIIHKINAAIDNECLYNLIDEETGLLQSTAPDILENIFESYVNISAHTLADTKQKVEIIPYNSQKFDCHSIPIYQQLCHHGRSLSIHQLSRPTNLHRPNHHHKCANLRE